MEPTAKGIIVLERGKVYLVADLKGANCFYCLGLDKIKALVPVVDDLGPRLTVETSFGPVLANVRYFPQEHIPPLNEEDILRLAFASTMDSIAFLQLLVPTGVIFPIHSLSGRLIPTMYDPRKWAWHRWLLGKTLFCHHETGINLFDVLAIRPDQQKGFSLFDDMLFEKPEA